MKTVFSLIIVWFLIITPSKADELQTVLKQIEKGFTQNNVQLFSDYFGENCYLSLNDGTTGYYTSNQTYYIFEKYFSRYKIIEFKISDYSKGNVQTMIEASIKYSAGGVIYNGQVLITVKNIKNNLVITQIFIS